MPISQNKHLGLALNRINLFTAAVRKQPHIAVSGIQRTGTNYLCACLDQLDIRPINYHRVDERHPMHKHTRWNCEKFLEIPSIAQKYRAYSSNNITSVNALSGYPASTCHIVIRKSLENWLVSIANFALSSGWYPNKDIVLDKIKIFAADYEEYYSFWCERSAKEPHLCQIIDHEFLLRDFGYLPATLKTMGIIVGLKSDLNYGKFEELNMSPRNRAKVITRNMVENSLS